jgi:hypothetical protein
VDPTGYAITSETEIVLDGKPLAVKDFSEKAQGAEIVEMAVDSKRRVVLKIVLRSAKDADPDPAVDPER